MMRKGRAGKLTGEGGLVYPLPGIGVMLKVTVGELYSLYHCGDALPHTDTHGGDAKIQLLTAHNMNKCSGDPRSTASKRVSESNSPTIEIHLAFIYAKLFHHCQRLPGKGLIELKDVYIIHRESSALESLFSSRYWAYPKN